MSTAEQITPVQELAKHAVRKSYWDKWVCICGGWEHRDDNYGDILTAETRELHAAHVVAALTNAGKVVVDVPSVAHKGPFDTDAAFFRQVAQNLDRDLYAGGSNVRHAVSTLLRNVADALTDDRRTTTEIRSAAARVAEGGER